MSIIVHVRYISYLPHANITNYTAIQHCEHKSNLALRENQLASEYIGDRSVHLCATYLMCLIRDFHILLIIFIQFYFSVLFLILVQLSMCFIEKF